MENGRHPVPGIDSADVPGDGYVVPHRGGMRDYVRRLRRPEGFVCRRCGAIGEPWVTARGVFHCRACAGETSLTAGTIFEGTRKPLGCGSWRCGSSPARRTASVPWACGSHRRVERLLRAGGGRLQSTRSPSSMVASLLKRWLIGTHQGGIQHQHLDYYLDEFTFRFNRRRSQARGLLFHRLAQQAVCRPLLPHITRIVGPRPDVLGRRGYPP